MAASKYDFAMEQGSSFKLSIVYKDSSGTPINLTNYCARLTWKTDTGVIQIFSSDNTTDQALYKFIIDDAEGKLTFMIPSHATNQFNFSIAKYDFELQSNDSFYGDGSVNQGGKHTTRILFGTINLVKRYSQSSSNLECPT